MPEKKIISVIIVSYNVREFLEHALHSVERALNGISSEVFVVDNASVDGSGQMVKKRFPDVHLIESDTNLGFSAANNLALKKARGRFIVLLNPDTVVQEDTFSKLLDFFEEYPDCSAVTPKILNPDGTFSVDCRHSIPTPLTAFWKMIGFAGLFPRSRIFGKYNLTYMDENEISQVEAISGSFMMMRRSMVKKVGFLDEDFFMYCEDIDYCHRINQQGGKIYYVPNSQIIHYKGESTKKNNLDYAVNFNRSLYKFYKKHYQQKYVYPFKWLILLGTVLRAIFIFFRNNLKIYYPVILDMIILNVVMFISFYLRYEIKSGFHLNDFFSQYIVINVITTITYVLASLSFESLNKERYSVSKIIKANGLTYLLVAALTFFLKQFAYSRGVVLVSALISPVLMVAWRIILRAYSRRTSSALGEDFWLKRTLIVGFDEETKSLLKKLQDRVDTSLNIVGIVGQKKADIGKQLQGIHVVTSLDQLPEYLRLHTINLVLFTTHKISYESILTTMAFVQNPRIDFKMVPGHLEFMIGKSSIERLDNLPMVDIEYPYGKLFNRFVKRMFDLMVSGMVLTVILPFNLFILPLWFRKVTKRSYYRKGPSKGQLLDTQKGGLLKWTVRMLEVFKGKLSLVGAPIEFTPNTSRNFDYKPGLTGLVQLNRDRIQSNN
ncbi:MAG: glycosyltransferase, partial [Caldithrix sp.]|nr:glycosyltransferase [Caldithrix sp.]